MQNAFLKLHHVLRFGAQELNTKLQKLGDKK